MKIFGRVFVSEARLASANLNLKMANMEENFIKNPIFTLSEEMIKIKKNIIKNHYNKAAEDLGFKNMKHLLEYQKKWKTDIVHGIWEEVLAE